MTMSVGLGRVVNDPTASVLVRKALGALSTPALIVTDQGITIDDDGRIAVKLNPNGGLSQDEDGLAIVADGGDGSIMGLTGQFIAPDDWIGVDVRMTVPESTVVDTAWSYYCGDMVLGVLTTVDYQYGYYAGPMTIGVNRIAAFVSEVATPPVGPPIRWNAYLSGTAWNYFNGAVGIGVDEPASKLHVQAASEQARFGDSATDYLSINVSGGVVELDAHSTAYASANVIIRGHGTGGLVINSGDSIQFVVTGGAAAGACPINLDGTSQYIYLTVSNCANGDQCFATPDGVPSVGILSWSACIYAANTVEIRVRTANIGGTDTRVWRTTVIRFSP